MTTTATTEAQIPAPPPPRITVRLAENGPEQTIFMSFARLNELTPLVGGPERMAEFDFEVSLRQEVVRLCLAPRDEKRKIAEDYQIPEDFGMDQAEILIDWAKEHVLNFFMRRLVKNLIEFEKHSGTLALAAKLPSQTG